MIRRWREPTVSKERPIDAAQLVKQLTEARK